MINIRLFIVGFILFLASGTEAIAICTGEPQSYTTTVPSITIPPATTVGAVIWEIDEKLTVPTDDTIVCQIHDEVSFVPAQFSTPAGTNIFATNVPGIGIKIQIAITYATPLTDIPYSYTQTATTGYKNMSEIKIQLIKTGTIISGTLNSGDVATGTAPGLGTAYHVSIIGAPIVPVETCTVTDNALLVPLGNNIPVTSFTGPGSTSEDIPFSIPLDCLINARVNFQLDGVGHGEPGVLSLNNISNSATGVGVQIMYKNNPVVFGSTVLDGTALVAGPYNVDFVARYYQTGGVVTPGPGQATATFTITYQ
ncbi:fimbrial protein [Lelliottia wanjuensis]|uniref:Fimbrial protein n=1 Tax=Lelliottia wanjuensis TaxID=3050585 RepID=A0AAP4LC43_9ENTR|nr:MULTISPECIES: fimbrial protein [unclassified Lelliottia]EDS5739624.1 fimbrial protein [Salmonella enterica subsp. enterica serovar Javiana]EEP0859198.1 fimbrial protein [Salmonella enterica]EGH8262079.1 fimbrial protein [Salmonella enterica]EGL2916316.1 fimbrial protein [Salmonella enterica]EJP9495755.1 fimbrial protein [Salmonella enterica]